MRKKSFNYFKYKNYRIKKGKLNDKKLNVKKRYFGLEWHKTQFKLSVGKTVWLA